MSVRTSDEEREVPATDLAADPVDAARAPVCRQVCTLGRLRAATWALAALFAAGLLFPWSGSRGPQAVILNDVAAVLAVLAALLYGGRVLRLQARAARRIAGSGGWQSVGPLLDAAGIFAGQPSADVREALVRLLPQMPPSAYAGLADRQRRTARRILLMADGQFWRSTSLLSPPPSPLAAILRMLEQCGGQEWLPTVEHVARKARHPGVRSAARQCLEYLRDRLEEERPTARLLRPAEAPEGSTLLRPAPATQETPQEQLLRPVGAEEGEG